MPQDHPTDTVRPQLVVFDVNETLSDMSPLAGRFEEVGAPGHLAATWFASVLRDGFALTAVGENPAFAELATGLLRGVLAGQPLDRSPEAAVDHVMTGFATLEVHPDVRQGITALADLGLRLVTLSNGSTSVAEGLLARAGLSEHFERLLSVEQAGLWKPGAAAYRYALAECGVAAGDAMLVAVHPWDVDGAGRAGLQGVWVNRSGGDYPGHFRAPDGEVASLVELADRLR